MTPLEISDRLVAQRVVPVLRLGSSADTERAVDCLADAGFRVVEITLTVPGAVPLIKRLIQRLGPSFVVGAGTVLDFDAARACIDTGARFLVSPCIVPGLARLAHEAGRAALIGGFTPGEILAAHREGADIVKVFPASTGGPEHLRGIHAVFPDILLCPTGGIGLQNLDAYFAAGASLVGVGNNIVDQQALAAGDAARVVAHARRFLALEGGVTAA
ncbi:MAG TPA: bifunctional 4-hydroxy-2-oxoglutarate aldolase/2-dehydro-3-deoxy-phosphogluconate aldolase [Burkholderiales bacterium]|nr:bifunctional 4-hydroxy-2-oxoglutarate aldolase/2-dehydro-3-deoxy-phosphogluconate aldolase [Burkholderiales bacterium]